jgi:hypothetical protein
MTAPGPPPFPESLRGTYIGRAGVAFREEVARRGWDDATLDAYLGCAVGDVWCVRLALRNVDYDAGPDPYAAERRAERIDRAAARCRVNRDRLAELLAAALPPIDPGTTAMPTGVVHDLDDNSYDCGPDPDAPPARRNSPWG